MLTVSLGITCIYGLFVMILHIIAANYGATLNDMGLHLPSLNELHDIYYQREILEKSLEFEHEASYAVFKFFYKSFVFILKKIIKISIIFLYFLGEFWKLLLSYWDWLNFKIPALKDLTLTLKYDYRNIREHLPQLFLIIYQDFLNTKCGKIFLFLIYEMTNVLQWMLYIYDYVVTHKLLMFAFASWAYLGYSVILTFFYFIYVMDKLFWKKRELKSPLIRVIKNYILWFDFLFVVVDGLLVIYLTDIFFDTEKKLSRHTMYLVRMELRRNLSILFKLCFILIWPIFYEIGYISSFLFIGSGFICTILFIFHLGDKRKKLKQIEYLNKLKTKNIAEYEICLKEIKGLGFLHFSNLEGDPLLYYNKYIDPKS